MKFKLYLLISITLNVFGQFFIKYGINKIGENLQNYRLVMKIYHLFTYPYIILGLFFYVISAFFWITALSKIELSIAYPMLSLGYILIMLISFFFLKEEINYYKILGTFFIILGIILIQKNLN